MIPKRGAVARPTCCPIVELRRYAVHPGQRDKLISLFDERFVESQEDVGARIIGQFRQRADPNAFVWIRGFPDMETRLAALTAFYTSQTWRVNSAAANATMVDVANVRLLRPVRPESGFQLEGRLRPRGDEAVDRGVVVAELRRTDAARERPVIRSFEDNLRGDIERDGGRVLAYFVTERSANNFPALPVIEGEDVFVWFSAFPDLDSYRKHEAELRRIGPRYDDSLIARSPDDTWILEPSARSLIP